MDNVIKFNDISQLEDISQELATKEITVKVKNGKEVVFKISEADPECYVDYADVMANIDNKESIKKNPKEYIDLFYKLLSMSIVNDKNERIFSDSDYSKIKRIIPIQETARIITEIFSLSGLSKESAEEIEKNLNASQ